MSSKISLLFVHKAKASTNFNFFSSCSSVSILKITQFQSMTSQSLLHLWVRKLVARLGSFVSFDTEVTGSTRDERDRWHEGLLEYTRLQRAVLRHWLSTDICPTLGCFTNPFPASAQGCFSSGGCQPLALSVMKTKQSSPPRLVCGKRVQLLSPRGGSTPCPTYDKTSTPFYTEKGISLYCQRAEKQNMG